VAARSPSTNFGFFSGRVGIAYAAFEVARLVGDDGYVSAAESLLEECSGQEASAPALDAMDGAAGAVPALLRIAERTGRERWLAMARAYGDRLVASARMEPVGWSWNTGDVAIVRNLTGYARGASGMGFALVELFAHTGEGGYAYAAEQAFAYERQFFDEREGNWLDQRHGALADLVYDKYGHRTEDLGRALLRGMVLPPFLRRFPVSWCYGAPGIALARLRAFAVLGDARYAEEARVGIDACVSGLRELRNFSLCHGIAGAAEPLLVGAEAFTEPAWRMAVANCIATAAKRYEFAGDPWPCGTEDRSTHPGLMIGESGIGYFCLRLVDPSIPSLLAPSALTSRGAAQERPGRAVLRKRHMQRFFSRTLRIFAAVSNLRTTRGSLDPDLLHDIDGEPVKTYEIIRSLIEAQSGSVLAELLNDAFGPERCRFELARAILDFTGDYLHELVLPVFDLRDPSVVVELRPETRLIRPSWDWDEWVSRPLGDRSALPERPGLPLLLHRKENWIDISRVDILAAELVEQLERGAVSVAALTDELQGRSAQGDLAYGAVHEELRRLCQCGAVGVRMPSAGA
jgi:hypothetical protein